MSASPPHDPAHSAAWHVGPAVNGYRSVGLLASGREDVSLSVIDSARESSTQKNRGALRHPSKVLRKNYRFFAAFFFAPLAAFFAIGFSPQVVRLSLGRTARPSQRVG